MMAYDAHTLKQISVFCTTPTAFKGAFGKAAGTGGEDREGTYPLIYAVIANGSSTGRNYGESVSQLFPGPLPSMKQAFTPANRAYLNDHDLDNIHRTRLASGPPLGCRLH